MSAPDAALRLRPELRREHPVVHRIRAAEVHQILGERQIRDELRERLRRQGRHSRREWCGWDASVEGRRQGIGLERPQVR